eukprot:15438194-Alexandrium_andersonii.AAC.1
MFCPWAGCAGGFPAAACHPHRVRQNKRARSPSCSRPAVQEKKALLAFYNSGALPALYKGASPALLPSRPPVYWLLSRWFCKAKRAARTSVSQCAKTSSALLSMSLE